MSPTEAELIREARAGSEAAAAALFDAHWSAAWRAAYRVLGTRALADDVAQEAMTVALTRLDGFREQSSFRTWLTRIVVTRSIDALRRERRQATVAREAAAQDAGADSPSARAIVDSVRELPLERRLPVVLRYWLDWSPTEISELLEIPPGTVNSRISRGLAALRERLEVHV